MAGCSSNDKEGVDDWDKAASFIGDRTACRSASSLGAMAGPIFQFAFITFLPAVLAGGSTYFGRARNARRWWFLLTATAVLYVVYVAIFYAIATPLFGGFEFSRPISEPTVQVRSLYPNLLRFYATPLVVFLLVAAPIVVALLRLFGKRLTIGLSDRGRKMGR
jgi:hypothetical protein